MPITINTVTAPVNLNSIEHVSGSKGFQLVNDAASPGNDKYYGTNAGGTKGWFDLPAGGGGGVSESYYDSGQGFWVKGTAGIVTTNPSTGNYTVTIPAAGNCSFIYSNFTNAGADFTGGGEVNVTIVWTGAAFNQDKDSEVSPTWFLVDSGGIQRNPGDVAVTVTTTSVSGSQTVQNISGINGLGVPVAIRGHI